MIDRFFPPPSPPSRKIMGVFIPFLSGFDWQHRPTVIDGEIDLYTEVAHLSDSRMRTTASTTPNHPRARLQFSLKLLMLLAFVTAVPCGWFKRKWDAKKRERRAVVAIQALKGEVHYDWEEDESYHRIPPGPVWLKRLLGDDFFADVTVVGITGNMCLSDEDLVHLDAFANLRKLWIDSGKVTDAGIVHIECLGMLTYLAIQEDQVTDAGVANLKALRRLTELLLSSERVTDDSVGPLQEIATLRNLSLRCENITDAGIAYLRRNRALECLDLSFTQITDKGLKHLRGLYSLRRLTLYNTQVTAEGVAELQKALPNCNIKRR